MASSGGHQGPDMTPMLDMVMQLLLYFIVCCDMLGREINQELVELPDSSVARRLDLAGEGGILYVNIKYNEDNPGDNQIIFSDKGPFSLDQSPERASRSDGYVGFEAELDKFAGYAAKDEKTGNVLTTVVLRADGRVGFGDIRKVMETFKAKKFNRFNASSNMKQES